MSSHQVTTQPNLMQKDLFSRMRQNWNLAVVVVGLMVTMFGSVGGKSPTYRAAVVEYQPVPHTGDDRETMKLNAHQIAFYAQQASLQNVDVMLFPEYGITTFDGSGETRASLASSVQDVPNPKLVEWNPCLEPDRFPKDRNEILRQISCAAHHNKVSILVNLLSREVCSSSEDPKCPTDGHYLYNTNVLFCKNGTLLLRYHKYNLFREDLFDKPPEPEYAIVDLGFAKLATFICYDVLHKEPAVSLVEKHNVRNLLYSTAWIDELPFYTSTQVMAQFAHGVGANLLASDMYYPEISRLGSGIYSSSNGALKESWDLATPGRMLVADVPVDPPIATVEETTCSGSLLATEDPQAKPESCIDPVLQQNENIQSILTDIPSSKPMANKTHKIYYEPLSNYSYVSLTGPEGSVDLCQGKFCCNAAYEFGRRDDNDVYVLAVRNGCRIFGRYNLGIQVCAILRCKTHDDIESCGRVPESQPSSRFNRIVISGIFQTPYIFPNIFSTTFSNVPRNQYQFIKQSCQERKSCTAQAKATLETTSALTEHPVLVASLYGRVYDWD